MEWLRSIISSLIILIAVPLLIAGTFLFILRQTVLSESYVDSRLDDPRIYEGLAAVAAEAVERGEQAPVVKKIISQEITPDRVKQIIQPATANIFQYFNGESNEDLIFDFRPLKDPIKATVSQDMRREIDQAVPDTINLTELSQRASPDAVDNRLATYKAWYLRFKQLSAYLPLIVVALLALLFLINTGQRRLWRPAHIIFVSGLILAAIGGLATFGLPILLTRFADSASELLPQLQEITSDLAWGIGSDIARWTLLFGLGYVIAAAILFVFGFILFREKMKPQVAKDDRPFLRHRR